MRDLARADAVRPGLCGARRSLHGQTAPRTLTGLLSINRALKAFGKELPADIIVTGKQAPDMPEGESDKAKRLAKEEKRAAKQAKKEEKRKEKEAAEGDFWMMKEGDSDEHENGSDQTGE